METNKVDDWILDCGVAQNIGARKEQQDYFATSNHLDKKMLSSRSGFLAVVADGMGGHADGANASVIAVNKFVEKYKLISATESIAVSLNKALCKANTAVAEKNRKSGGDSDMGTTLCACVLQSRKLYWISAGDSEILRFRNGKSERINEDHSYGAELDKKLQLEQITPDLANAEARRRNQLTSYLGLDKIPKIDLPNIPLDFQSGDKVLLCSDGLINAMSYQEIANCVEENNSAQEKCDRLIQEVLKRQRPQQDNVTIVLFEFTSTAPVKAALSTKTANDDFLSNTKLSKRRSVNKGPRIGVVVGAIFLAIIIVFGSYYFFSKMGKPEQVIEKIHDRTEAEMQDKQTVPVKVSNASNTVDEEEIIENVVEVKKIETVVEECDMSIAQAQDILSKMKQYPPEKIDGMPGNLTRTAILTFQQIKVLDQVGLTTDNKINSETCKALRESDKKISEKTSPKESPEKDSIPLLPQGEIIGSIEVTTDSTHKADKDSNSSNEEVHSGE